MDKHNIILEKLKGLEDKIKMSIPTEQVLVTETRLFGRFTILTKMTYLDLKDNWMPPK